MNHSAAIATFLILFQAVPAAAIIAEPPYSARQAVVRVICDGRQGSGTVTHADGYVITNGHLVIDTETRQSVDECTVSFVIDDSGIPKSHYKASVVRAVLDEWRELDFAVLKIGGAIGSRNVVPPVLASSEFASVGTEIAAIGFPGDGKQTISYGTIGSFQRGTIVSDAQIQEGSSGGAVLDAGYRFIGVATKYRFTVDPQTGKQEIVDYQMGDVLQLINWLDRDGPDEHDKYLTHVDPSAYHVLPYLIRDELSGCQDLVRTTLSPTVYCILTGAKRLVFPNDRTYASWYPDFGDVFHVTLDDIARFQLVGNITYKAGTLVKITTDPKVYMVSDSIGTLRWIPSEERAAQYFGPNWAARVKDVPDEFFVDYRLGQPLP